ncbi:zinc transport system substrate-binding protein [Muricomes intestini]|uniref:Zinc transport system substrate-binding protein n=1 Tax=Muricomes intestini TaxID=1796634 RepID=A0A4R3K313_9FIRM|nr:metal ABC transporter substrate-binding protein [Muricomes intestini]TCS77085.1 zinc transport system substrate-binding protein [Muricomes intestini]
MKKSVHILLTALIVSCVCAACGTQKTAAVEKGKNAVEEKQSVSDSSKLKVMASFYPMYDFAQKVGGDKVEVTNMVPAGTEPHDWEPAAADIKDLEEADVFVYNGAGLEHWVEDVLDSLDNKDLTVAEASKDLELMEGHHHEEEEEAEHEEEGTGYDPHVWLSPINAKVEMENIKNALAEADPENEGYYTENYEKYAAEFDKLDTSYKEGLADAKSKDIIAAHEAFGYLCSAYDLNQIGIEGLSPDSEPDPARMKEIIQFAEENEVKTIFFEELVSPKVAETIADEIGAKTEVLNPLEGLSDEELKAGEDYFSVMETNLETLKEALNQ